MIRVVNNLPVTLEEKEAAINKSIADCEAEIAALKEKEKRALKGTPRGYVIAGGDHPKFCVNLQRGVEWEHHNGG